MHALERPHLPRIGGLALGAVLLAIVVLLLAASQPSDIGVGSPPASSGAIAGPPAAAHGQALAAPSWFTNPLGALFRVGLPWGERAERR